MNYMSDGMVQGGVLRTESKVFLWCVPRAQATTSDEGRHKHGYNSGIHGNETHPPRSTRHAKLASEINNIHSRAPPPLTNPQQLAFSFIL
ncbi:hypothetical protein J6590_005539 [Homalodisca vitripennis]|nr:hypothetical protein J6590_005539 [Homalodisca vitripennis]